MVKMFYARRNPDPAEKKQIMDSSSVVADIMLKHISQECFGKLSYLLRPDYRR